MDCVTITIGDALPNSMALTLQHGLAKLKECRQTGFEVKPDTFLNENDIGGVCGAVMSDFKEIHKRKDKNISPVNFDSLRMRDKLYALSCLESSGNLLSATKLFHKDTEIEVQPLNYSRVPNFPLNNDAEFENKANECVRWLIANNL